MLSAKGAYRLRAAKGPRQVVLVASGSEVKHLPRLSVAAELARRDSDSSPGDSNPARPRTCPLS